MHRTHLLALLVLPFALTGCALNPEVPEKSAIYEMARRSDANLARVRGLREAYAAAGAPEREQIEAQWKDAVTQGHRHRDTLQGMVDVFRRFGKGWTLQDHGALGGAAAGLEIDLRREELLMDFARAEAYARTDPVRAKRHFSDASRLAEVGDRDGKLEREWERVWAIVHAPAPQSPASDSERGSRAKPWQNTQLAGEGTTSGRDEAPRRAGEPSFDGVER
jgi:hypothetical protein